jgi:hypothetical protein
LSTVPINYLSFFKALPGIISILESLFKNFLWGGGEEARKIHWVKWKSICKPKEKGGLGIRDLRCFNLALLCKWWCRLKNESGYLWRLVIYQKNGQDVEGSNRVSSISFRDLKTVVNASRRGGIGWFDECLRKEIRDGKGTSFWLDPWIDELTLRHHFARLFDVAAEIDISVPDMIGEEEELLEVCNLLVIGAASLTEGEDRWKCGTSEYTVKEAYLHLSEDDSENVDWVKDVWHPLIPLKMPSLIWRAFQNRLPHVLFNCPILSALADVVRWRLLIMCYSIVRFFLSVGTRQ